MSVADPMTKQYIVCLTSIIDPLDTTYGPFPTVDAAEAWLKKRGLTDDSDLRILELQPDLDQDFIDGLAADKKANAEILRQQKELNDNMERLKDLQT